MSGPVEALGAAGDRPATAELQACPNCGQPVSKRDEHFIDAERLGIDWICTTREAIGD